MSVDIPDLYSQLRLPDTELAVRAYRLSQQGTPEFVFNHSVRSYLFAEALAGTRNLRPGTDYDQELLFLGCVLHDIGLSDRADDDQRFEVDGADLAAEFLREQHVAPERIAVVWDAIALHTSDGIAGRKAPEVAIAQLGIAADILGRERDQLPADLVKSVHVALPRHNLSYALTDAIVAQGLRAPGKASPLNFAGQLVRRHLPADTFPDWYDLIANTGWGDKPATLTENPERYAATPEQLAELFMRLLAAGDLDGLVSLYEPGATLVPTADGAATGTEAIRESLQALIHDRVSIKLVPRKIQVSGDVALVSNVATLVGATPDGSSVTTHTTEVLRRQPDGHWTYLIDDPFFG